jgi:single-stranded DNA-binding protein
MDSGEPKILVQGRIHYNKWTDATGTDRYGCGIIAEKVDFLSRPKLAESENPSWPIATTRSHSEKRGLPLGPG